MLCPQAAVRKGRCKCTGPQATDKVSCRNFNGPGIAARWMKRLIAQSPHPFPPPCSYPANCSSEPRFLSRKRKGFRASHQPVTTA